MTYCKILQNIWHAHCSGQSTILGNKISLWRDANQVTHIYPIPEIPLDIPTKTPLFCNLSEIYANNISTTAETAYGGTVNNCASALATARCSTWNRKYKVSRPTVPKCFDDGGEECRDACKCGVCSKIDDTSYIDLGYFF